MHPIGPDNAPWGRRIHCYLVGLLLGYVLHATKGKKFKIPFILNSTFWLLTMSAFFSVMYAGYHTNLEGRSDTLGSQIWWSLTHFLWAAGLFLLKFFINFIIVTNISFLVSSGSSSPPVVVLEALLTTFSAGQACRSLLYLFLF